MHQKQTAFENIMGKGEIACNEQFLPFSQCFLLNQILVFPFVHIFDIISLFAAELEEPKIGISGRGLNASANSIDTCQPTKSLHADLNRNSLLSVNNFLHIKGIYPRNQSVRQTGHI